MRYDFTNKQEWLEQKRSIITSTESPALFGLSPYKSALELWHEKKDKALSVIKENERMHWGDILEKSIGLDICDKKNWKCEHMENVIYLNPKNIYMGSSFDFFVKDDEKGKGILEIKNVDKYVYYDSWSESEAPLHIEMQLQHQLEVADFDWGCIGALIGGNELKLYFRERDKKVGDKISNKINDFYDTITLDWPPEPDFNKDSDFIISKFSVSNPESKMDYSDDKEFESLCEEYKKISREEKVYADEKKSIKAQILLRMQETEKVTCNRFSISAKTISGKTISYEKQPYRDFRINEKKVS